MSTSVVLKIAKMFELPVSGSSQYRFGTGWVNLRKPSMRRKNRNRNKPQEGKCAPCDNWSRIAGNWSWVVTVLSPTYFVVQPICSRTCFCPGFRDNPGIWEAQNLRWKFPRVLAITTRQISIPRHTAAHFTCPWANKCLKRFAFSLSVLRWHRRTSTRS